MSVPAATVVLSFSQDPIDELFAANSPTNVAAVLSDLTKGNEALVFNNQGNPNFISMTHSFANANEGWKVELKLVDPDNEFERRWFTSNVMALTGASFPPASERVNSEETSQEVLGDENTESIVEAYQKAFGLRYIFLAYGVGTNINSWAGPIKMTLASANISGKGAKEVTLTFVPVLGTITLGSRRGAYNEMTKLNLQGLKEMVEGISEPFRFESITDGSLYTPRGFIRKIETRKSVAKLVYRDRGKEILDDLEDSGLEEAKRFVEKVDIHAIVVDVIRQYIQNASGSANVIVLLPNINWICRYAIDVIFKESFERRIESLPQVAAGGGGRVGDVQDYYGLYYEALFKILSSFNLDFASRYNEFPTEGAPSSEIRQFALDAAAPLQPPPQLAAAPIPFAPVLAAAVAGAMARNYAEEVEEFYDNKIFEAKKIAVREEAQIIDHGRVLSEITSAIMAQSKSNYRIMGPVVLYEGDTDLLNIWKRESEKSPLFFGNDSMTEIDGSPDPVIIFGDASLIKRFLYAREDLDKTKEEIADIRQAATDQFEADFYSDTYQGQNISNVPEHQENLTRVKGESLSLARNHAPLHPMDSLVLMDKTYNEDVKRVLYKSGNVVGAFGSISNLPKDFSDELASELQAGGSEATPDYLTQNGIPVFRYNYQNPNITNIDFNFGPQYFIELLKGFRKNITNLASTTVGGVFVDKYRYLPLQSKGAGLAYIRQREICEIGPFEIEEIRTDLESLYENATFRGTESAEEVADEVIKVYSFLQTKASYKPKILIDQFLPGRPDSILADMTRQMYTRSLQLNIKTLPTFHLSNTGVGLQFPALVLAQDAPIIGSDLSTRSPLNRIWSGLWSIFGWSHTISNRNVESSFRLVKTSMNTTQEGTDEGHELSAEEFQDLSDEATLGEGG